MKRISSALLIALICSLIPSCADHDDPQLAPIDTTQVKITASVSDSPNSTWLTETEEITIRVSDVEMTAPKGVVLRNISLIANCNDFRYVFDEKPFSGDPLEFKIPLTRLKGRVYFSLRGTLIKKDCRDAEVIIKDNIQKIVFSEKPEFECEGWLSVSVSGKSTSGEEYNHSFEVTSTDHFTIPIPQNELYWTPLSGEASTIEVTLKGGAKAWSPNTSFKNEITNIAVGNSSGAPETARLTIPNKPGSLTAERLQLYVRTSYFGTWEGVTIDTYNLSNVFDIVETE